MKLHNPGLYSHGPGIVSFFNLLKSIWHKPLTVRQIKNMLSQKLKKKRCKEGKKYKKKEKEEKEGGEEKGKFIVPLKFY